MGHKREHARRESPMRKCNTSADLKPALGRNFRLNLSIA
jgi:hypothetical protein